MRLPLPCWHRGTDMTTLLIVAIVLTICFPAVYAAWLKATEEVE
jgi:hypothetical protein